MAVQVTEAERRRLGLAPQESLLLASRKRRALALAAGLAAGGVGGGLAAAGQMFAGGALLLLAIAFLGNRARSTRRFYLTQTRILVRSGGREAWHELADVSSAQREPGLLSDGVRVRFHDAREPLVLPNVPNANVVVAHILSVAARATDASGPSGPSGPSEPSGANGANGAALPPHLSAAPTVAAAAPAPDDWLTRPRALDE